MVLKQQRKKVRETESTFLQQSNVWLILTAIRTFPPLSEPSEIRNLLPRTYIILEFSYLELLRKVQILHIFTSQTLQKPKQALHQFLSVSSDSAPLKSLELGRKNLENLYAVFFKACITRMMRNIKKGIQLPGLHPIGFQISDVFLMGKWFQDVMFTLC